MLSALSVIVACLFNSRLRVLLMRLIKAMDVEMLFSDSIMVYLKNG